MTRPRVKSFDFVTRLYMLYIYNKYIRTAVVYIDASAAVVLAWLLQRIVETKTLSI